MNLLLKKMKVIKRQFYVITHVYDKTLTGTINSTFGYKEY